MITASVCAEFLFTSQKV